MPLPFVGVILCLFIWGFAPLWVSFGGLSFIGRSTAWTHPSLVPFVFLRGWGPLLAHCWRCGSWVGALIGLSRWRSGGALLAFLGVLALAGGWSGPNCTKDWDIHGEV